MSLICPSCGNSIDQDFGVITCARCAAVLFIDMEGRIQVAEEPAAQPSEPLYEPQAPVSPPPLLKVETSAENFENPSEPESSPSEVENRNEPVNSSLAGEMFSEVSEFGNTDQAFGALSYSILIENIDTSSTRQKLFEALSDAKFQWDAKELLQQIEQGRLQLTQLNPAKASVLVRCLQDVPVKVSWDQKLL